MGEAGRIQRYEFFEGSPFLWGKKTGGKAAFDRGQWTDPRVALAFATRKTALQFLWEILRWLDDDNKRDLSRSPPSVGAFSSPLFKAARRSNKERYDELIDSFINRS